ncbi:hypothetical protein LXA43DRAFT_1060571 [Ganoderma leucocontextum]|nr:hypothetical protein LXA43DRAFT_1060571 [Ganoderma leucocontextum]
MTANNSPPKHSMHKPPLLETRFKDDLRSFLKVKSRADQRYQVFNSTVSESSMRICQSRHHYQQDSDAGIGIHERAHGIEVTGGNGPLPSTRPTDLQQYFHYRDGAFGMGMLLEMISCLLKRLQELTEMHLLSTPKTSSIISMAYTEKRVVNRWTVRLLGTVNQWAAGHGSPLASFAMPRACVFPPSGAALSASVACKIAKTETVVERVDARTMRARLIVELQLCIGSFLEWGVKPHMGASHVAAQRSLAPMILNPI